MSFFTQSPLQMVQLKEWERTTESLADADLFAVTLTSTTKFSPLLATLPQQTLGWRLPSARRHRAKLRGAIGERGPRFSGESLPEDFPMLFLSRAAVAQSAALQAQDEIVVDIANIKTAGHIWPQ